jgi:hypothetical protein
MKCSPHRYPGELYWVRKLGWIRLLGDGTTAFRHTYAYEPSGEVVDRCGTYRDGPYFFDIGPVYSYYIPAHKT